MDAQQKTTAGMVGRNGDWAGKKYGYSGKDSFGGIGLEIGVLKWSTNVLPGQRTV